MRFGQFPLSQLSDAILAHTHRLPGRSPEDTGVVLKKGKVLGPTEIEALRSAGFERVWAAILDAGDVAEDAAAARLAASCQGPGVKAGPASTGRVNLFAERRGFFVVEPQVVDAVNLVDPGLTLATLTSYGVVETNEMVATIKVIPFAVPEASLSRAIDTAHGHAPVLAVAQLKRLKVALLLTELPGVSARQLERAEATQVGRVEHLGSEIRWRKRVAHETRPLATALRQVLASGADLVLMLGASAVVDAEDILPSAIVHAGGHLVHIGMPVDPGNLLVLGQWQDVPIIGVPGCARSPKRSGFDAVLERVAAGLPVRARDIQTMGYGGLLAEVPSRPRPRSSQPRPASARIGGILLAAGRSTRMGPRNKLLEEVMGRPMVIRSVDALVGSRLDPLIVVVGFEAERLRHALRGRPVKVVDNPNFAEGLSTSLIAGIRALDPSVEGVLIALGDMPFVSADVIELLVDAFDPADSAKICVPVRAGRRGNPVLFAAEYFEEMMELSGDRGAKDLLQKYSDEVREVEVADEAIHIDVDTPTALEAVTLRRKGTSG